MWKLRNKKPAFDPLAGLLTLFDLAPEGTDVFLGQPGRGRGRLFGGLVAAQAVIAAGRSVDSESRLHSLHAYFLRPGSHEGPIRFAVDRIRDGRSFTTRRVVAEQGGEAIFNLAASFARPEPGIAHQERAMPEAPDPQSLPEYEEMRARMTGARRRRDGPILVRDCNPAELDTASPSHSLMWMRTNGTLPDDPLIHTAMLVFASDRRMVSTAARPHDLAWSRRRMASLDHAFWLHQVPRFDDWVLYETESPVAHAARGLVHGAMYTRDGVCFASVAQEGLVRMAPEP